MGEDFSAVQGVRDGQGSQRGAVQTEEAHPVHLGAQKSLFVLGKFQVGLQVLRDGNVGEMGWAEGCVGRGVGGRG